MSDTPPFPWSRQMVEGERTIFNLTPVDSMEARFAQFLDRSTDVSAWAKLAMNTRFALRPAPCRGGERSRSSPGRDVRCPVWLIGSTAAGVGKREMGAQVRLHHADPAVASVFDDVLDGNEEIRVDELKPHPTSDLTKRVSVAGRGPLLEQLSLDRSHGVARHVIAPECGDGRLHRRYEGKTRRAGVRGVTYTAAPKDGGDRLAAGWQARGLPDLHASSARLSITPPGPADTVRRARGGRPGSLALAESDEASAVGDHGDAGELVQ